MTNNTKNLDERLERLERLLEKLTTVSISSQEDLAEIKTNISRLDERTEKALVNQDWLIDAFRKLDQERVFGFDRMNTLEKELGKMKIKVRELELKVA